MEAALEKLELDAETQLPLPLPFVPENGYEDKAVFVKATSMDGVTYQWTQLVCTFDFFNKLLQDYAAAKWGYEISVALNEKLQSLLPKNIQAPSALTEIDDSIYKQIFKPIFDFRDFKGPCYKEICPIEIDKYNDFFFCGYGYSAKDKKKIGFSQVIDFGWVGEIAENLKWFQEARRKVSELNQILVDNLNGIKEL